MAQRSKPPVGGSRFFKLAGLTVGVASDYASTRLRRVFQSEERAREEERLLDHGALLDPAGAASGAAAAAAAFAFFLASRAASAARFCSAVK